MSATVYGRWLYAVGINARAATVARIPGARVIALSYVLAGLMAGVAAIMLTGRLASASSNLASPSMVLDVISACVVGGISIYGGAGKVYGAVLGALFLTLLSNALNAAEVTVYVNQMIRGAIIVAFVARPVRGEGLKMERPISAARVSKRFPASRAQPRRARGRRRGGRSDGRQRRRQVTLMNIWRRGRHGLARS